MKNPRPAPPNTFLRFFRWFCHPKLQQYIEGDLLELYHERLKESGKRKADIMFSIDVLLLFRPGIVRPAEGYDRLNSYGMLKNYFKIGWRNLLRYKGYAIINIGGLAMGMAVAIMIGLWMYDELSYDKNFDNYDRIARVVQNQTIDGQIQTWFGQAMQLGPELRNSYGNNFEHVVTGTFPGDFNLAYNNKLVTKSGSFMEPGISEMLTLKMLSGTRAGLKDLNSILLSQSAARALFGDEDPMDKFIKVDNGIDVKVTGVYEDIPDNSSFSNLALIMPWQLIVKTAQFEDRVGWGNSWFQCFVQIHEHASMESVSAKIRDAKLKRVLVEDDDARFKPELFLHPMSRWKLYSEFKNGVVTGGDIQYVWMLGIIGVFVLFLACINFMNLSTARSERRAKEVGIRKTIGSVRAQLISQFFTESLLVAMLALVFSLVAVQLALPWFNEVSGKRLNILWHASVFWLAAIGFAVVTGLVAGSYPALYLSSFRPVRVLKGALNPGRFAALPRKVLVVLQFTVSVSLIIGTIVIFKQLQFAQNRPIGYNLDGLISLPIRTDEIIKHYESFRQELLNTGVVEEVAASESPVTSTFTTNSGYTWKGKDPNMSEEFVTVGVTHEFGKTIGWEMSAGHDFSKFSPSDSSGFIINEAAVNYMGLENPVGEVVKWGNNGEWKIIGVIKNLVTQSPYSQVKPMILFLRSNKILWIKFTLINIKIAPNVSATEALARIEPVYKKYDPGNAFEYRFENQEFGKKFNEEKRIGNLAWVFASLAIFISCLGLLGLASFIAEQRTKEIGIRKVLGASVIQLWRLLSKDFVLLVAISCVISIPLSLYFMNDWLMRYEYRMVITWHIFAIASAGAIIVTLLTVSYQTIKAAIANPTRSLRSE